ncbi:putative transporter SEO1 [Candida viswanathii]|uniref:Putative transporter SEO1 n=1 Tax=Candida viswanathii TaxID=5486 RepID=A0A367XZ73_9ASCO|nr:putative transporter SEO1 [Candida viswanathii]
MYFLKEPLGRLKWGFLPTRRIVDEDGNGNFIDPEPMVYAADTKTDIKAESSSDITETEPPVLEYRDEKGRPWWKFFDEFEYRIPSETKLKRKFYHWFHPDDTPEEKRLILKIDFLLTFYSLFAMWVKYLDQTNLINAYVGGMKEGLDMQGNDFVNTQVMFSIGNIVFQIPFMYVYYALPLNYVIPAMELCWSVLTVCLYKSGNVAGLKAIRFFIGSLEAPAYLCYHAMFSSWYKAGTGEINRRGSFCYLGLYLGVLTSGLLSGAIERHLGGVAGHAAWQWIFIIDGIISVAVGIFGFYMIPGTPEDCYSIFLTDDDIRVARRRMRADQKDPRPREHVTKYFFDPKLWKKIFTSWHIYVVAIWHCLCWNNTNTTSGAYALWLKSLTNADGTQRYSEGKLQDYTALTPGLGLIWLALTSLIADLLKCRWGAIVFSQVFNFTGNVLLAVWNIPERAKWFAWCMQFFGWAMAPIVYSWQGDICRKDVRERQVVLISMNVFAQQTTAWLAVLVWKTVEGPRFLKGYTFTASCAFALCVWTMVVLWFYKRQERANARENGIVLYDSSKQDIEEVQIQVGGEKPIKS